jgi:hypothetical protein
MITIAFEKQPDISVTAANETVTIRLYNHTITAPLADAVDIADRIYEAVNVYNQENPNI